MNVLFLSAWGGALSMAYRMKSEGHETKLWIQSKNAGKVGLGFVELVKNWEEHKNWADLIICDDSQQSKFAEKLRKEGSVVWGGTAYSDKLEMDRGFGQKELKEAGLTTLPYFEFKALEQGIAFVKSHPARYVVKMDGPIQDEKALTYVGKLDDGSDMMMMLEQFKRWGSKITSFQLQTFAKGVEIGVAGFFNGHDFVEPIEYSFEHKKLMNENVGPGTGEMGTTQGWTDKKSILYRETIAKMVNKLKHEGYIGYFCIGCIATADKLWPLEFTSRFGYPTIHMNMETMPEDLATTFFEIATGKDGRFKVSSPIGMCVVMAMPPYPFTAPDIAKKYTTDMVALIDDPKKKGIWPAEMSLQNKEWVLAGESGFSLIVTGQGRTIEATREQVYERVKSVTLSNVMYRTDIGDTWEADTAQLRAWKWLN